MGEAKTVKLLEKSSLYKNAVSSLSSRMHKKGVYAQASQPVQGIIL